MGPQLAGLCVICFGDYCFDSAAGYMHDCIKGQIRTPRSTNLYMQMDLISGRDQPPCARRTGWANSTKILSQSTIESTSGIESGPTEQNDALHGHSTQRKWSRRDISGIF